MGELTLVANPGSASRKYAIFDGETMRASLHFEHVGGDIVCTLETDGKSREISVKLDKIAHANRHVVEPFQQHGALKENEIISRIGLRVVAPSSFWLQDHPIDDSVIKKLEAAEPHAPLHIKATLQELRGLREQFKDIDIIGVSDSAFHAGKPDRAWNYGLPLKDADKFEVKRYGYHGLSAASIVRSLHEIGKLPPKLVICHLGSGASVTAVGHGKSLDNTMGYSPLDGLVMASRSGSVDPTAIKVLKDELGLNNAAMQEYLNHHSGLQGLGGSPDIRELLKLESEGDQPAHLALETYVYNVQKAIGQMSAALNGIDLLVFTATVGERSAIIRERVLESLRFLDFDLDEKANKACQEPSEPTLISRVAHSKPAFVVPANEAAEIGRHLI